MDIIAALLQETDKILILLTRFSGLMLTPIFSAKNIPLVWKTSFVLFLTYFGWLIGLADSYQAPDNGLNLILVLVSEILIGVLISLVAQFIFASIQLAGQIMDFQMGFGIVQVMDPFSGIQVPMLGNFYYILAMLILLQIDGHHLLIQAIVSSYQHIPIGQFTISGGIVQQLVLFFGEIFITGLKLALPLVGSLIIVDVIMGIISRTVPQMNIFMVGMPVKILFGFGVLFMTLPLFIHLLNSLFDHLFWQIDSILRIVS